jgi:hypothetical protein
MDMFQCRVLPVPKKESKEARFAVEYGEDQERGGRTH